MLSAQGRRLVFLTAVALALGGYAYLTTPETRQTAGETAFEHRVLDFDPQAVLRVEVVHEGDSLVCRRTPGGWKVEPAMRAVRAGGMTDFLHNLADLVVVGEVAGGSETLLEYGLRHPSARISLYFEEADSHTLALGIHNPVHTSLYAQVNDAPRVILVGSVVLWEIRKLFLAAGSDPTA